MNSFNVKIGSRSIGPGNPCFITFEIGPTHNGLDSAKRLIRNASEAGADAVKFQILDPERLVADRKQVFTYSILKDRKSGVLEEVQESLYDIMKRRSLTKDEWRSIKTYCDECGVAFFATAGFFDEVEFLAELGCNSIKIASADINHTPLLKLAANTGMCVQIDTGMSSIAEIEEAVSAITGEGNNNIIIHQCPSGYPARLQSINLKLITTLRQTFPFPIAFSDHSPGLEMDVAALAMGASLIEKTITEDRMTRSVEHVMSLETDDLKPFIDTIKNVEIALGSGQRNLHSKEIEKRKKVRRGIYLLQDTSEGTQLDECKIEFRRPEMGITPHDYEKFSHAKIAKNLKAGDFISIKDLAFD